MFRDYYEVLELNPPATNSELKTAYRKQCIKWHPDKNPNQDTTKRMQLIIEAYLFLKDEEARRFYDIEYKAFKQKFHTHNDVGSSINYEYSFEVSNSKVSKWMDNAKAQARKMRNDVIDEFKGATREASKSILNYFLWYFIPMMIGFILFKMCNSL
ncbi:MAG: J domain-containing protein [Polaribacter sp.]